VGRAGVALTNGNYATPDLRVGQRRRPTRAASFGNGTTGTTGVVSSANSLVGSTSGDDVGHEGLVALPNGNYLVRSPSWNDGALLDAGAVTWCSGTTGRVGAVSAANSLVGSSASDQLGLQAPVVLANGHYVVRAPYWDNGATVQAGAVTWGSGTAGVFGPVSAANTWSARR
jgi:hypothetical protein